REMSGETGVRLLADRAGVEDDDVRLLLDGRLAEAELLEHALDPLAVVSVHLAAERGDVVAPHGRRVAGLGWAFPAPRAHLLEEEPRFAVVVRAAAAPQERVRGDVREHP